MKNTLFFSICILFSVFIKAQESEKEPNFNRFQIGFGGGMGFFNPSDINSYIRSEVSKNNWVLTSGTTDMFENFFCHVSTSYTFENRIGISGKFEIALSPKIIYINNSTSNGEDFYFWRFSPGVFLNYAIPISKQYSINPEVGLFYHNMRFDEFEASSVSPRFQLNLNYLFNEAFGAQLFLGVDFASAQTNSSQLKYLDYSGVVLGFTIFVTP